MRRAESFADHLRPAPTSSLNMKTLYVANRGIVAQRVIRTAKRMGWRVVGGYCKGDSKELFVKALDESVLLDDTRDGPTAYTNVANVIAAAKKLGAKYVHPGIGFLSESGDFANACENAGLVFVGPSPQALDLCGNKFRTCELATRLDVPNLSLGLVNKSGELNPVQLKSLPVLLKATNGGGGLGLRLVTSSDQAKEMYERCLSEAKRAFASDEGTDICVERYLTNARHVEVQLIGDGSDFVTLGDRECSVQRKFQKVVEIAPCPALSDSVRSHLASCAVKIARELKYKSAGTFEFLVQGDKFFFIECNPRLQVEHTVTEQIYRGLDIVECQLKIAQGIALRDALPKSLIQHGCAIQCRVCAEQYNDQGQTLPVPPGSRIRAFDTPRGVVRLETLARTGYVPNTQFDSLVAQLICTEETFESCCQRMREALSEFNIIGCPTNLPLLGAIFRHQRFLSCTATTTFLDEEFNLLRSMIPKIEPGEEYDANEQSRAAVQVERPPEMFTDDSKQTLLVSSPMQANVVSVLVQKGTQVVANKTVLVVLSALKMEHEIRCSRSGIVNKVVAKVGDIVEGGNAICEILVEEQEQEANHNTSSVEDTDATNSEVYQSFFERVAYATTDAARPEKTKGRLSEKGRLTARQIMDKMFEYQALEYGRLATNGYQKHSVGDGLYVIQGLVNQKVERPQTMVLAYDYTVLAGTQGLIGHKKKDRAFELMLRQRLPIVLFAEGGGGRSGDAKVGGFTSSGLDGPAFTMFAKLAASGVPLVGAVSGFCFAGNAALLGTCDVIVATGNTSLGMGGPAMIEGGGLGVVRPEEVGPIDVHFKRGVVDLVVEDDNDLVSMTKKVLSYFQGRSTEWAPPKGDHKELAKTLRNLVPVTNRRLAFDVRVALRCVFDHDSIVELKGAFAKNLITCLARIEGRPVGVMANDCRFVSGTLDANGSKKAADFLRMCSKHRFPVVVFCDTPGFLVGVESEKEGLVKRAGELFVAGVAMQAPLVTVVIRRCVGLGGQAMCGGDLKVPVLTVAWPTGEFGAMGLEGAVRLGFREELKQNPEVFDTLVSLAYERGKAVNTADHFEIDDVIDPADTRRVVNDALSFNAKSHL